MKAFKQLPYSFTKVRRIEKLYNKAFHTKVFTLFASAESEVYTFAQLHKPHYDFCLVFNRNLEGPYFLDDKGVEKVRKWVISQTRKNPQRIFRIYAQWKKDWRKYLKLSGRLLKLNLSAFTDKELYLELKNFYYHYLKAGGLAYICDSFMSSGKEDWLEALLAKELKEHEVVEKLEEKIRLLTSSTTSSFARQEELELERMAALVERQFSPRLPSLEVIKHRYPKIYKNLRRHASRYFWIENNYYNVDDINLKKVYGKIAKLIKEMRAKRSTVADNLKDKQKKQKTLQIERRVLLKKLRLTQSVGNILKVAQLFIHWKDTRKSGVYIGMHHFDRFLEEIARRKKISKSDLTFLVFWELKTFFLGGRNFSREIKNRKSQTFYTITPKGYYIVGGKQADPYFKILSSSQTNNTGEIRGVCAFPGYAKGKVRVLKKTREMKQFKNGEILVTNQTTPEFMPIMRKAAGIVTEQGGITSHAAVISRELHIPCVIGTKIATEVLKDGDLVEVNANHGVVTVIKRA